jgi:sensor histidine kinase YesM
MTGKWKKTLRLYAACFAVWTALGLFLFSQGIEQKVVSGDPNPWWHHLTSWMVGVWIWCLLTPLILYFGARFSLERKRWIGTAALHLALSITVSFGELALEAAILRGLRLFPTIMVSYPATLVFLLVIGFHQGILTYWIILAIQYAYGWYRRYEERRQEALRLELRSSQLERQLVQAHLSALKMQLQPHFLFNTLNAIMVLVRQQRSQEAEEMLGRLSDLLRCVLEDVDSQEIALRRELEYLELYLSIEEVRFRDRLRVEIAASPEVLDARVPPMVLQPIVENAIRHGISCSASAGRVRISACRVGDVLEIRVQDDGPGLAPNAGQTRGIGLTNTRARIGQLYAGAAHLTVENDQPCGVLVTLVLPFRPLAAKDVDTLMEANAVHSSDR